MVGWPTLSCGRRMHNVSKSTFSESVLFKEGKMAESGGPSAMATLGIPPGSESKGYTLRLF